MVDVCGVHTVSEEAVVSDLSVESMSRNGSGKEGIPMRAVNLVMIYALLTFKERCTYLHHECHHYHQNHSE